MKKIILAAILAATPALAQLNVNLKQPTVIYGKVISKPFNAGDRVGCDNSTFGDPARGYKKQCYAYPNATAQEGGTLIMPAVGKAFYCVANVKNVSGATFDCDNKTFGDPANGLRKKCYNIRGEEVADEDQKGISASRLK
ncbi:MAG: hypothetical protein LBL52_01220 [Rickettsiales bacterium]|jgi:hypothetical protein|nr:hypothetical protein [Rickettsiales bacterium]